MQGTVHYILNLSVKIFAKSHNFVNPCLILKMLNEDAEQVLKLLQNFKFQTVALKLTVQSFKHHTSAPRIAFCLYFISFQNM